MSRMSSRRIAAFVLPKGWKPIVIDFHVSRFCVGVNGRVRREGSDEGWERQVSSERKLITQDNGEKGGIWELLRGKRQGCSARLRRGCRYAVARRPSSFIRLRSVRRRRSGWMGLTGVWWRGCQWTEQNSGWGMNRPNI